MADIIICAYCGKEGERYKLSSFCSKECHDAYVGDKPASFNNPDGTFLTEGMGYPASAQIAGMGFSPIVFMPSGESIAKKRIKPRIFEIPDKIVVELESLNIIRKDSFVVQLAQLDYGKMAKLKELLKLYDLLEALKYLEKLESE